MKKQNFSFSASQIIMISFFAVILIGSLLLCLPISSASGDSLPFIDALFTATSATCVTGLVTLATFSAWSVFGQAVILILIQIGGLGTITIMAGIMIALNKKMGIGDRLLIQDAFNLNSLSGLVRFVKKVFAGTFLIETAGALLYMTVFVPQFGLKGIWISFFTAISAFCNAGFDIISSNSLCSYAENPIINFTTCALIILGGIGYIVIWDILLVIKKHKTKGLKCFRFLSLHSKIALFMTALLILSGAILIFVFEFNNPLTLKEHNLWDKIQISLFQSITTRTAGFASIPQENLTNASSLVSILLMFIGGSPVGTAGGIKTVTFCILICSAHSTIKNRERINLFSRSIPKQAVNKALAVFSMSFLTVLISTLLLLALSNFNFLDILYETVSATATVGLTRNLTPLLDTLGKIIIAATMYLGRIGPISLATAFNIRKENNHLIKNPTENISVG
jgi:trk system potassium uptake protein TrkH